LSTYQIEYYRRFDGHVPYEDWFRSLQDLQAKAIIRTRLNRVQVGNFGDCEPAREGVHELKIDYGPGYRVYFGKIGLTIVLILCGGPKKTQSKDISLAITYFAEYKKRKKEEKNADKKTR
jgi:putative addiction module killer protein